MLKITGAVLAAGFAFTAQAFAADAPPPIWRGSAFRSAKSTKTAAS